MNSKKTINKFKRFLKNKGVWAQFILNYKDKTLQHSMTLRPYKLDGNVGIYLRDCPPSQFLSSSFCWHRTIQGDQFWRGLSQQWNEMINKK